MSIPQLEQKFRTHLQGKRIAQFRVFNVNEAYFVFDPKSQWVIDGGIEISLDSARLSYGWDFDQEGFDYSFDREITEMLGDTPHFEIEQEYSDNLSHFEGKSITDISLKWQYYVDYNEDGEVTDEKTYVPVELILQLDGGNMIQLALVDFEVGREPFEMINTTYDLGGQLLVSLNREITITQPEGF